MGRRYRRILGPVVNLRRCEVVVCEGGSGAHGYVHTLRARVAIDVRRGGFARDLNLWESV